MNMCDEMMSARCYDRELWSHWYNIEIFLSGISFAELKLHGTMEHSPSSVASS